MSRRAAIVEEEFDDDTDLPLPLRPLPNTGSSGPLLEEIHISDDEFDFNNGPKAGPAYSASSQSDIKPTASSRPSNTVTDITPYKKWSCIYPIYIDAKRPYGTGSRRIARPKGVWWPLSKDIADATNRLGLGTLHEINKAHPRDWENPGRVRVQWKKDGKLVNPNIKNKKQLLEMISFQIQRLKPENIPKPPYTTEVSVSPTPAAATPSKAPISSNKGKQPLATNASKPTSKTSAPLNQKIGRRRLPNPPEPLPSLASRVSPYSPALSTGVLVETVKAGMNALEGGAAAPGGAVNAGSGTGAQKGKRKVVRVRG